MTLVATDILYAWTTTVTPNPLSFLDFLQTSPKCNYLAVLTLGTKSDRCVQRPYLRSRPILKGVSFENHSLEKNPAELGLPLAQEVRQALSATDAQIADSDQIQCAGVESTLRLCSCVKSCQLSLILNIGRIFY